MDMTTKPHQGMSLSQIPSNAAIRTYATKIHDAAITLIHIGIFQRRNDLIHPVMSVQYLLGQGLSPDLVELAEECQGYG